jgi:hypothetical protein
MILCFWLTVNGMRAIPIRDTRLQEIGVGKNAGETPVHTSLAFCCLVALCKSTYQMMATEPSPANHDFHSSGGTQAWMDGPRLQVRLVYRGMRGISYLLFVRVGFAAALEYHQHQLGRHRHKLLLTKEPILPNHSTH